MAVFVKFEGLKTADDQRQSEELQKHAVLVMTSLDTAFSTIEDGDEFVTFLETTGAFHRKIPGFKKEFFWVSEYSYFFLSLPLTSNVDSSVLMQMLHLIPLLFLFFCERQTEN